MMGRSGRTMLAVALLLGAWAHGAPGGVAAQAARPTQAVAPAGCVTSECHADVKAYPVPHGPVNANTCDACHRLTDAGKHTFELTRQKAALCTYCHQFDTGKLPVVHKPVMTGECLGCHNPHGGTNHGLTREATTAQLCGRCHDDVTMGRKFLHQPAKTGECSACHRPHASKYPKLLDAVGADLCLACHRDFASQMGKVKFTHQALNEGCTKCHDPHGANNPKELTQTLPDLCLNCHKSIKQNTKAEHQHPAVLGERACLTCHTPHGGDLARLMSDQPGQLCMSCHDKPVPMKEGGMVPSMAEINNPALFKHAPIRDGQCGGCHTTHGGDKPLLLREAYSTKFHENFSEDNYALCFSCHNRHLAEREQADGVTNFRNGNRNLHFVHVAKQDIGRNCRVCHGTHTSKYASLIRDSAKYGEWKLPIRFDKTATGGTCMTGCHPILSYDREHPVAAKSALPIKPSPRVPVADEKLPLVARWSAQDIRGAGVKVPADGRTSVLLFLRADQPQSRQALKLLAAATPQIDSAQVVVVVGGPQAAEFARTLDTGKTASWPIVADAEFALSKRIGVEVWPATLVVQPDGVQVAHIGGTPPSLTVEVGAYLDLATKKIDRQALEQRLARHDLVGDGPVKRASWYLQMGRKLLDEGQAEQAQAMLADGLKLQPDSVELRVEMVRTLVELKQALEGLDLLKQLPAGALPDWERDLLRGRMLAVQGQWEEVRRLAERLRTQKPDLGQTHFLLGMVYEHDRNWEKAAAEYRAASRRGGQ